MHHFKVPKHKIGFCYDRNSDWANAEKFYSKALTLTTKTDWQFRLGFVQEKQLKLVDATKNYQMAAYWFYRCAYCLESLNKYSHLK